MRKLYAEISETAIKLLTFFRQHTTVKEDLYVYVKVNIKIDYKLNQIYESDYQI